MTHRLSPEDHGRIHFALEQIASEHPDETEGDKYRVLAERIINADVELTDPSHAKPQESERGASMRKEFERRAQEREESLQRTLDQVAVRTERTEEETAELWARLERLQQLDTDSPDRAE